MKINWNTVFEAIKLSITVFIYGWAKELPPDIDNQLTGSLIDFSVAAISAVSAMLILNLLFGLPKIKVEWVVGEQIPMSDRPELTRRRNGIFFRYSFEARTGLSKFILWMIRKYEVETVLAFSPADNVVLVAQYLGDASVIRGGSIVTNFGADGPQPGNAFDGDFSLNRRQERSVDTPIDCKLSLQPRGRSERSRFARLVCRWVKADTGINGFLLKGDS